MNYRFSPSVQDEPQLPSAGRLMALMLTVFAIVSIAVLLAGRVPFVPSADPISGPSYRDYVVPDRALLSSYGYTLEGNVHIPIDRAMELIAERGLPTRDAPLANP
ncbi:MAG: hypothetical protein EOM24_08055 [Chloroflexia bacterium]|nr:hypothetical protein [Chloroflexia bacterium]